MMCKHCNDLEYIRRNPPPMLRNPDYWSDEYKDFVEQCLVKNFEERPTIAELMQHPFIQQIPKNPQSIKDELARVLQQHKRLGLLKVAPEVTTKCGRLKESRRTKARVISADDLAALEHLTEVNNFFCLNLSKSLNREIEVDSKRAYKASDTIVKELEKRYNEDNIYTYVGDILIAFNPFKLLPIYSQKHTALYQGKMKGENPPHIFAIADSIYHSMLHQKHNQKVGLERPESANFLLKQLVLIGKAANRILEDKILQVNPIIEAFGNATTGFNDNSS
ncbi:Myosin-IIIa [Nymphon striatum]|nr:Myosin-IIIa [Nymphon striatum]